MYRSTMDLPFGMFMFNKPESDSYSNVYNKHGYKFLYPTGIRILIRSKHI